MTTPYEYFEENLKTISPDSDPEKWNLYNGLCALSQHTEMIYRDIDECRQKLDFLIKRLND